MPKVKESLQEKLKTSKINKPRETPLWKGPEVDGVTQSLLGRYIADKERFRLLVCEGLKPADTFNQRLEYGNMWHICEEHYAAGTDWRKPLKDECKKLIEKYRNQQDQVVKWYNVCLAQFPIYVKHWSKSKDTLKRQPLLSEAVFKIPYATPTGRVVWLRGKFDSVDLIGGKQVWLQENKTKGEIEEMKLMRQLKFDLQTMFYLTALDMLQKISDQGVDSVGIDTEKILPSDYEVGNLVGFKKPIVGVRYNVIRRPLSGGKGSISQHKPSKSNPSGETEAEFYQRLGTVIEGDKDSFFMRWNVLVSNQDLERFKTMFLDPILEDLCYWWDWIEAGMPKMGMTPRYAPSIHWQMPYGVYNPALEGNQSDLDDYLETGNMVGLQRATTLFSELE